MTDCLLRSKRQVEYPLLTWELVPQSMIDSLILRAPQGKD